VYAETIAAYAQYAVDNSTYVDVIQENLLLRRKITELTRIVNEHESAVNRILDP
jgi:replicative DNA helicase